MTNASAVEPGMRINIFSDPLTRRQFEGVALIHCVGDSTQVNKTHFLTHTQVQFDGDSELVMRKALTLNPMNGPEPSLPESELLSLIANWVQFPFPTICKHSVCLDVLDRMERRGYAIPEGLAKALCEADNDAVVRIINEHGI